MAQTAFAASVASFCFFEGRTARFEDDGGAIAEVAEASMALRVRFLAISRGSKVNYPFETFFEGDDEVLNELHTTIYLLLDRPPPNL